MYARGIHARKVRINHKHPYTGGRDLELRNMSFCEEIKGPYQPPHTGHNSTATFMEIRIPSKIHHSHT